MAEKLFHFGQHWNFKNGDRVLIYQFDDKGTEVPATIRGKSFNHVIDSYIVEPDTRINANYDFDCICITEACLKSIDPNRKPVQG